MTKQGRNDSLAVLIQIELEKTPQTLFGLNLPPRRWTSLMSEGVGRKQGPLGDVGTVRLLSLSLLGIV